MKWIIYILLSAAAVIMPGKATDVGKLIPVEVIAVSEEAGNIYIEADTGDTGQGRTLAEAIANMEDTASGVIYLDTAEYLILEEDMEAAAETLKQYLKENVRVCAGRQGIALEGIASYLSVHRPEVRLREVQPGIQMPAITEENGRFRLTVK